MAVAYLALFKKENIMRKSGVLLHISSLPSPYGIGTMGTEAKKFIDFLWESGQSYWQVLPVSPTGFGDSPYQSFSSFAGNPYFIDLDTLCDQGFLQKADYIDTYWGNNPERIDYGAIYCGRFTVLRKAAVTLLKQNPDDFQAFCQKSSSWLDDYALFMALKDSHSGTAWNEWEAPLRFREEAALNESRDSLADEIKFYKTVQYFFYRQWSDLKSYAHGKGISIIGDLPIYAAPDSSDVWASPQLYMLDENLLPTEVAGCPPDGFTCDGQLWGNPLYNWEQHKKEEFTWWIGRLAHQFELYDVLRIDHFRGFDAFYAIPYGASNAKIGVWHKGPGMELFRALRNALGDKPIIAEDLGFLDESVRELLRDSGFPGMKVMQFAFDNSGDSDYLPHNYTCNCVAYTGTHDNSTTEGWFDSAPSSETEKARDYLRIKEGESTSKAMICSLWESVASLAIAPMQDFLELGADARMNTPSTLGSNWQWRLRPELDLSGLSIWLKHITELYGRI